MSNEPISNISETKNEFGEDDKIKLNNIEQILSERIYILSLISKRIEDFKKEVQLILEDINKYFHSPVFDVEQKMREKLRNIINNYQINNEINRELKNINDSIKKLLNININDFPDNQKKNDIFYKLNDNTLVIASQCSIKCKHIPPNNNEQNKLYTFTGEIKNCCSYKNKLIVNVKENTLEINSYKYKLKIIDLENDSITNFYETNEEITFVSESKYFSGKIFFIEYRKTFCIYEKNKEITIKSSTLEIHSFKEIQNGLFFCASYNTYCFYDLNEGDIISQKYNGNIFNPDDIFILTNKYLMLGAKKYFYIFNIKDYKIKIKLKLHDYIYYSCVNHNYGENFVCVYINNQIIIYEIQSDNNKINLSPLIVQNINYQVYSLIYYNKQLLLYTGNLQFKCKRIE